MRLQRHRDAFSTASGCVSNDIGMRFQRHHDAFPTTSGRVSGGITMRFRRHRDAPALPPAKLRISGLRYKKPPRVVHTGRRLLCTRGGGCRSLYTMGSRHYCLHCQGLSCWKKSLPLSSTRMKAGKSTTWIFQMASMPSSGYSTHSMLLMLFILSTAAGPPMEPR